MEDGLGLVLVERAKVLVDFVNGLVVFREVDRDRELALLAAAAAGTRILETVDGSVVLATLGAAFVFTLAERPNVEDVFCAGIFTVDADGALIVRGAAVLDFEAVDLVERGFPGDKGESSPGIILPTSSIASSSASSASMGSSDCD